MLLIEERIDLENCEKAEDPRFFFFSFGFSVVTLTEEFTDLVSEISLSLFGSFF